MDIFCACPFAVALLGWEPAPGRRSVSVCVKATFVLVPGAISTLAPLQEPVRADEAGGGAAPDLVPFKPRVDILFAGHAHAPGGALTDSLIARARIGAFRKSLSINGDRTWVPSFDGLRPSVAVPFRHMPLTYERAVRTGENLTGVDISQGAEPNRPLANIAAIADQGGETPGLSPIPLAWRALRLGLGDPALLWASRVGLAAGPPPQGFDFRVFNAAPAEQQVDDLPPGVDVLLENLHPELPRLETRLPALRVKLFRRPPHSEASVEIPARCDTLWIDTDRGLAMALWRGAVLVEGADDDSIGRLVVAAELDGERLVPADVDRMLSRFAPEVTYVDPASLRGGPVSYPPVPDPIPVPAPSAPPPPAPSFPVGETVRPPAPTFPMGETPAQPFAMGAQPYAMPEPPQPTAQPFAMAAHSASGYPPPPPPAPPPGPAGVGDDTVGGLDEPTPQPGERRGPITLVPPPAEPSTVQALPFRPSSGVPDTLPPPSHPRSAPPAAHASHVGAAAHDPRPNPRLPAEAAHEGGYPPSPNLDGGYATVPGGAAVSPAGALPAAWAHGDDDTEVTPPRGYPTLTDLHAQRAAAGGYAAEPPAPTRMPSAPPTPLAAPVPMADPVAPVAQASQADPYCALKMEIWRSEAPLRDVLAHHGVDETSFRAHEAAQRDALGREAAEGKSDLAIALLEGLGAGARDR